MSRIHFTASGPGRRRNRRALLTAMTLGFLARRASTATGAMDPSNAAGLVLQRLRAGYLDSINPGDAAKMMSMQASDGTWTDIDYNDRSRGNWKPEAHLGRTRSIAVAYNQPRNALYKSPAARSAVVAALRAWVARKPASDNWWHNTIGPQLALMPVLVLMADTMPPDLLQAALGLLTDPRMVPRAQSTGENLVWYAQQQIVRGALRGDAQDIARASGLLQAEAAITTDEGIQADYSFHQHGAQLYTGAYGLGFLMDSVRMAALLDTTPWAYAGECLQTLADYALDGVRPLVRGRWLDWSARGREFTRLPGKTSRPQAILPALRDLAALVPQRQGELAAFAAYIGAGSSDAPVLGNRHYWRSDFMVHQTPKAYASVKMVSSRTVGTEAGNGENLRGYWLPFGTTYLLKRGDEYDGLPPVWDWSRLPGTTAPAEVPAFSGPLAGSERFVGGVSDGRSGIAAMVLNQLGTSARKAWFFDGDLMVALGTDIGSTRNAPVATTLNQTRWRGEAATSRGPLAAGTQRVALHDVTWVWHDGLTYLLPGVQEVSLTLAQATGSGRAINADLGGGDSSARVFTLTIEHGTRPQAAAYAYAVWMGAAAPAAAGSSPAFSVLENSPHQQSIRHGSSGLVQAVMHEPGHVALNATDSLRVDSPCLLQARPGPSGWTITVADPSASLDRLALTLSTGSRSGLPTAVAFTPGAAAGGKSVTVAVAVAPAR